MKSNVVKNASWIVVCRIIQAVINLIISMLTARYLGPSNYGVISYVSSVVAFALPIMQLGFSHTLVKEFIQAPEKEGSILGTAFIFNIISSIFSMLGCIAFVSVANAGEKETILVCALYSLTLLFQATEMIRYWFQAKLLAKYSSIATLAAYVVVAIYKVFLLVSGKSVIWFAFSNVLDYFLISVIMLIIYKKIGGQKFVFDWKLGRAMLSRSIYYIVPGIMVMIFQHTDQIMLKLMIGDKETGIYSAAIMCIGVFSFIYTAIIDSVRPIILEEKKRNQELYEKRIIQLYCIITVLSLAQSICTTLLAKPIIWLLYGEEYIASVGVLSVAVWFVTFSHFGVVRNVWILAEGKQMYLTGINVIGAVANVILNACLIPFWGAIGAAIASVVTQFFTNVIVGFIFKPIRRSNYLMIKGLNPKVFIGVLRGFILSIKKRKIKNKNKTE